jgi:hypothetical protein
LFSDLLTRHCGNLSQRKNLAFYVVAVSCL